MKSQGLIKIGLATFAFLFTDIDAEEKDRDTLVREDRGAMQDSALWIYNDVDKGFALARKSGRPLLILFR